MCRIWSQFIYEHRLLWPKITVFVSLFRQSSLFLYPQHLWTAASLKSKDVENSLLTSNCTTIRTHIRSYETAFFLPDHNCVCFLIFDQLTLLLSFYRFIQSKNLHFKQSLFQFLSFFLSHIWQTKKSSNTRLVMKLHINFLSNMYHWKLHRITFYKLAIFI